MNIPFVLTASATGCVPNNSAERTAESPDTLEVNFELRSAVLELDIQSVSDSLEPGQISVTPFHIRNSGDGALTFKINIVERNVGRDDQDDFTEPRFGWNATTLTGDNRILGAIFDGTYFMVSGGNSGDGTGKFYYFSNLGRMVETIDQPIVDPWGMRDLAYDGTNLYGACRNKIYRMDMTGLPMDSIVTEVIPPRGLAVNPVNGDIWVVNEGSPITQLSRSGELLRQFPHRLRPSGLAWNSQSIDGAPLWILSADGQTGILLSRLDTATGDISTISHLTGNQGDVPGGCELTIDWDSHHLILSTVMQSATGDRVVLYETGPNLSWVRTTLSSGTIEAASVLPDTIIISSEGLQGGTYEAELRFLGDNDVENGAIPVRLDMTGVEVGHVAGQPSTYALEGVFPNPTNGSGVIRYSLPQAERVRLTVYDQTGRWAKTLQQGLISAGSHQVGFDGIHLASGIYFVRLEAGQQVKMSKFVLLK